MYQRILNKFLQPKHYWRLSSFDELGELYITQFLRSFSVNLIGIFVPVYLYNLGYGITQISLFFFVWFLVRPLQTWYVGKLIGSIGPKHVMILSVGLQIAYLAFVISLDSMNWPLWLIAVIGSSYAVTYRMSFDVDFSKVKHTEHGGKEVGYLQIFDKVGGILGPIIGGLVAGFFDPRYAIAAAILVLALSLIPLLSTAEQVKQNQVIILRGFPLSRYKNSIITSAAYQINDMVAIVIWPLFLAIFVFYNNTYQSLGVLVAISTVVSIVAAYAIGKFTDEKSGKKMLNFGVVTSSVAALFKPFVITPLGAFVVNLIQEPLATMYRIPFMKGRYDESDRVPGFRIAYFMYIEFAISIAAITFWAVMYILASLFSDKLVLQVGLIIGALSIMIVTKQRFNTLR
jgi:MFS family permease